MAPKTKWGIVSAGLISFDFTNSLTSDESKAEHEVVAVAARSKDKAEEFAQKFDIPKAYGTYQELAQDKDVEAVYIGAINPAHVELCKLMINAGKAVLCEKPLGMNVRETKEILDLAKAKGVFFMEAMWARFNPAYKQLRAEIDKKTVGDIKNSMVTFGVNIKSDRVSKKELGGGAVLDIGIYTIFFSQWVFGFEKPEKIVAVGHLNSEGTDECVSATLTYKDGRTATMLINAKLDLPCEGHVFGTKGSMKLGFPFWCSTLLSTPDKIYNYDLPKCKYPFNFFNSNFLAYEAHHVRECLNKKMTESDMFTHANTMMLAEIMESIRKQVGVEYPQDRA